MNDGFEKAKAISDKLKQDQAIQKANERSAAINNLSIVRKTMEIQGLESIPISEIPLPFYLIIQPSTAGITMADGSDSLAHTGKIFKNDSGEVVPSLEFFLMRAKNIQREYTDDNGSMVRKIRKGILGVDTGAFTPFLMSLPVTSFAGFGQLLKQLMDRKVTASWQYPITMTTVKQEETKLIGGKETPVKYWTAQFKLGDKATDEESMGILNEIYMKFAASLDRENNRNQEMPEVTVENQPPEMPF